MIDWNRKYCEIGYNIYGIKWSQDGKLFRLNGEEVDSEGKPVSETVVDEPEEMSLDDVRDALDELDIAWHPNAKLETLKKRLEDATE